MNDSLEGDTSSQYSFVCDDEEILYAEDTEDDLGGEELEEYSSAEDGGYDEESGVSDESLQVSDELEDEDEVYEESGETDDEEDWSESISLSSELSADTSADTSGVTAFVIGDPHFKVKTTLESQEFVMRCIEEAKKRNPTFIVLLGDILDTHEIVRIQPHHLACTFIEKLAEIAHTYVLIGNHDYINHSQFLSNKHIFNPLKKWHNVTIVDRPLFADFTSEDDVKTFVFCPYVPPGRFSEALNTLVTTEGDTWELADCIFAHQEFYGCKMGAILSECGDKWDECYPPVISGHIHDAQTVGENVFYPGSSIQHAFGESPNKHVWFVTFDDTEPFAVEKISLGMKGKKIVTLNYGDLKGFDYSKAASKHHLKISLKGTSEEIKTFKKSRLHSDMVKQGIKFAYKMEKLLTENTETKKTGEHMSYHAMLKDVVATKPQSVQDAYVMVVKPVNIVFEEEEDE